MKINQYQNYVKFFFISISNFRVFSFNLIKLTPFKIASYLKLHIFRYRVS